MAAPRRLLASVSPATLGLAAAAGAGLVAFNTSKSSSGPAQSQKGLEQKPVFPAMGFTNLILEEARMVNHGTKELKLANQYKHLVLVAGGAGITPVFQVLRTALDNPEDKTRLSLIHANKTESDILMKKELDALASQYPQRFATSYVVGDNKTNDGSLEKGYVTKRILSKALSAKLEGDDVKVLVCGPPAMLDAVAGAKGAKGWTQGRLGGMLRDLGLTEKQVHKF